jgi:Na+/melibiose symporter-like transporter
MILYSYAHYNTIALKGERRKAKGDSVQFSAKKFSIQYMSIKLVVVVLVVVAFIIAIFKIKEPVKETKKRKCQISNQ